MKRQVAQHLGVTYSRWTTDNCPPPTAADFNISLAPGETLRFDEYKERDDHTVFWPPQERFMQYSELTVANARGVYVLKPEFAEELRKHAVKS